MTKHKQLSVRGTKVDQRLAEILAFLWAKNVHTTASCQGGKDELGYIVFESAVDAIRFASLARLDLHGDFGDEKLSRELRDFAAITKTRYAQLWFGEFQVTGGRLGWC